MLYRLIRYDGFHEGITGGGTHYEIIFSFNENNGMVTLRGVLWVTHTFGVTQRVLKIFSVHPPDNLIFWRSFTARTIYGHPDFGASIHKHEF